MAKPFTRALLKEDWTAFRRGPLHRDNTARGEYMTMVVPANPHGWYHNANAGRGVDQDHSPFAIRSGRSGRTVALPKGARGWGQAVILTQGERPWRDLEATSPGYQTNRPILQASDSNSCARSSRILIGWQSWPISAGLSA